MNKEFDFVISENEYLIERLKLFLNIIGVKY